VSAALGNVAGIRAGGEVLSVHRRALNLWLGGRLVSLVGGTHEPSPAHAGHAEPGSRAMPVSCPPFGVVIADGVDLSGLGIRAGMPCRIGDGWLHVGEARLSIRLHDARRWSPRLHPVVDVHHAPAGIAGRARLAAVAAAAEGPGGLAAGGDWEAQAHSPLQGLARSLGSNDLVAAEAAGAELIGLGSGLTPSGDDLLVGLTAALVAVGDASGLLLAGSWARRAARRTTPVAVAFHRYAAQGAYDELVHTLLGAVLAGTPSDLRAAVRRTAMWGATSGRDLLSGIVLGLEGAVERAGLAA
jgi:hypothetical protein